MALDGAHRDVQLLGDLGIAAVLADQVQHVRFSG